MKNVRVFLAVILGLLLCVPVFSDEKFRELVVKAKAGDADAQFNLGVMYEFGEGVPKDLAEALKWWRKAAEQGHAKAQFNLGEMYYLGKGVPKNNVEAAKWYRKAAEQGDADSQFELGGMYESGKGVPKSQKEGIKWIRKAAEQGHADAQSAMGIVYFQGGEGCPKDDALAYMWMNLASSSAEKDKALGYKIMLGNHAKLMSKETIAEGEKLTREWLERKAKENGE
ncbi:sel1 repeat family protein [bacterium]|nr:sel1 repeat family protein [bacterium]